MNKLEIGDKISVEKFNELIDEVKQTNYKINYFIFCLILYVIVLALHIVGII